MTTSNIIDATVTREQKRLVVLIDKTDHSRGLKRLECEFRRNSAAVDNANKAESDPDQVPREADPAAESLEFLKQELSHLVAKEIALTDYRRQLELRNAKFGERSLPPEKAW